MTGNLSSAGAAGLSGGREEPRQESRTTAPAGRQSAASADQEWIAVVVHAYEGPLTLYAARIVGDVERARDVVQEAMLSLCEQPRASIEPHLAEWLYTVCRNKALDVRRKESRMSPMSQTISQWHWQDAPAPSEALAQKESAARALKLLGHLPEHQQEVIRLKFQAGLSYKEISNVTKLSVGNVGFLIHTGLKTLREKMGADHERH